ncbi:MAG: NAD(P)H-binding protein [Chlorobiaceae bacterium]|nr:NAD(P)H-binding protein [Chlorobiaceae bacterium]NTV15825.1 NAD(P)H-binding protein [Chlorobiaceae bacterium]
MTILVAGATGATGRLLVEQLLNHRHTVKVIVRSPDRLPANLKNHDRLIVIHANILDLSEADMARHLNGCDAVASCLGHTISLNGMFGPPRRLVTDATRLLCNGIYANKPEKPVKFVLMNTTANKNRDLHEPLSILERVVFALVRLLLPPQADNEHAANYLRVTVGQEDRLIEWVVVRPDTLINDDKVTGYEVYASPARSPIFNAGSTSRINVAHFMTDLITSDNSWKRWRGQMPVIYNR